MTHWHIVTTQDDGYVTAAARYDNGPKSIVDYVDLSYMIFTNLLDEEDREEYLSHMLDMTENHSNYRIYLASKKLNLMWSDCDNDPCSLAIEN